MVSNFSYFNIWSTGEFVDLYGMQSKLQIYVYLFTTKVLELLIITAISRKQELFI